MSYQPGTPILARLRDVGRDWQILVHAHNPRSFSSGFLEAVKCHRRWHNSNGLDELKFLVGVLTPRGGSWNYGWFDEHRLGSWADTQKRHQFWNSLVEYERQKIEDTDPVRDKKIRQHIQQAQADNRYINLMPTTPGYAIRPVPEMIVCPGPLGEWFF